MTSYPDIAFTPAVVAAQTRKGSGADEQLLAARWPHFTGLTDDEIVHLRERDSFYLSTTSESGWPYVQHRGGPVGFVQVLDRHTIGWIERTGNRQYISAGNVGANDRVAAIFMDYPTRTRLKLYGHATYVADPGDELLGRFTVREGRPDGVVSVRVAATSWNCQKYITPRFTADQVRHVTDELRGRIAELEAALASAGG